MIQTVDLTFLPKINLYLQLKFTDQNFLNSLQLEMFY